MTNSNSRIAAVVIGRSGSVGLPEKNILPIAGRPMIAHSIGHSLNARHVDTTYCSTNGKEIALAARAAGAEVIMRPDHLANDGATVDSAVRHAIESAHDDAELIVILYGNIPVRPPGLIDSAIEHMLSSGADSVQSYAPVGKHHPFWTVQLDQDDQVRPWEDNTVYRRQDLPEAYIPDGGVIVVRRTSLFTVDEKKPHAFLGEKRSGIRSPRGSVIDVDDEIDFELARILLEREATFQDAHNG